MQVESQQELAVARLDASQSLQWAPEASLRAWKEACAKELQLQFRSSHFLAPLLQVLSYDVQEVPCFVLVDASGRAVCKSATPQSKQQMERAVASMLERLRRRR